MGKSPKKGLFSTIIITEYAQETEELRTLLSVGVEKAKDKQNTLKHSFTCLVMSEFPRVRSYHVGVT